MKGLSTLLLLTYGITLSGCNAYSDRAPMIVGHENDIHPLPPLQTYEPPMNKTQGGGAYQSVPQGWIPPKSLERPWQAIVIHHSATDAGNAAIFDRWHREGNQWEGVGYNFVIGNGSDSSDGEVEVTFRWHRQMVGAHCKTPGNWANEHAIGICLVGDFNTSYPSDRQLIALKKLLHFLQQRYQISTENIHTHQHMPGAIVTECPGRHFDLSRVL